MNSRAGKINREIVKARFIVYYMKNVTIPLRYWNCLTLSPVIVLAYNVRVGLSICVSGSV